MLPQLWTALAVAAASVAALPLAGQENAVVPPHLARRGTLGVRRPLKRKILRRRKCGNKSTTYNPQSPFDTTTTGDQTTTTNPWPNTDDTTTYDPTTYGSTTASSAPPRPSTNTTTPPVTGGVPAKFSWANGEKIRGVNLGGWLILEDWMTPNLLGGLGIPDQFTWDQRAAEDPDLMAKLKDHWATFITTDDINQIANAGLNTVRIPMGYWTALDGGRLGEPFLGGAYEYLDPVIQECAKLGITVLLTLHGLPLSQNGNDHSGHSLADGEKPWFYSEDAKVQAINAVDALITKYGNNQFGGIVKMIELANEPDNGDESNIDFLKDYFKRSYDTIRAKDPNMWVVLSDAWQNSVPGSTWDGFTNGWTNVAMDTHKYTLYGSVEQNQEGFTARVNDYCSFTDAIVQSAQVMPTFVGEWTCAMGGCNDGDCDDSNRFNYLQRCFQSQTQVYEKASGWIYWNWKLEGDGEWSFKTGLDAGWVSQPLTSSPNGQICSQ